jgi:methyl-accepting chemotaxis protein
MVRPMKTPSFNRHQILILAAAAVLPWVWAVLFIPAWISGVALVIAIGAIFIAPRFMPVSVAPSPIRPATTTKPEEDQQAVRRASRPLRRLLARWAGITQTSTSDLGETQGALQEVIEESETAVLNISKSFRNITSRSTQQIEYAMGLLQTTRGAGDVGSGDSGEGEMSLPEYIRAYEVLLNLTIDRLSDFSKDCMQILDKAVAGSHDESKFNELRDRLRKLAQENHADADQVRSDAVHLSGGMEMKNQQVTDVLKHINTTAQEIRKDVNKLIVAMQFQDITQQKLERLRGPLLSEIIKSLSSISDETRVLSKQLKMGVLPLPTSKDKGRASDPAGREADAEASDDAQEPKRTTDLGSKPKPISGDGEGNSVELF